MKNKESADDLLKEKADVEQQRNSIKDTMDAMEKERDSKIILIGNIVHESVPSSADEVIKRLIQEIVTFKYRLIMKSLELGQKDLFLRKTMISWLMIKFQKDWADMIPKEVLEQLVIVVSTFSELVLN